MLKLLVGRYVRKEVEENLKEFKDSLREEVMHITEQVCTDMVVSLFTEEGDTKAGIWGNVRSTVVGKLKEGIADRVFRGMQQDITSIEYIRGEEFIDTLVERILKKQLINTHRSV